MWQRHATDVTSLVAGTVFAGVTAVWLLNVTEVIDLEEAWLGGPVVLIIAGVVGLLATLRPTKRSDSSRGADAATDWVGAPIRSEVGAPEAEHSTSNLHAEAEVAEDVEPTASLVDPERDDELRRD